MAVMTNNNAMSVRKIIAIITLMLCALPSFSQEGFFHIYPSEGSRFLNSCAIETKDRNFIVAINNDYYYEGCAKLLKLSPEGEIVGSVFVNEPDSTYSLYNIFRHPFDYGSFIGTGLYVSLNANHTAPRFTIPYFIQFDDQLNITSKNLVELPDAVEQKYITYKMMLKTDWNFFCELMYHTTSTPPSNYHRLFTEMSLDGDFLRIVEDTVDLQPIGSGPSAVFEFPATHDIGTFRYARPNLTPGHPSWIHKLFRLDDNWAAEELNELDRFGDDTLSYNSSYISTQFNVLNPGSTDILPLNDSTLLFSMGADSYWYQNWYALDSNLFIIDPSAVLFKTDLDGNMTDFCLLKSYNDTIEVVPATATALTKNDAAGHKDIYHCCYSQYRNLWENPNTLTITRLTDNFEIIWQKSYTVPNVYLEAQHLIVTSDGGCLVVGSVTRGCNLPYSQGEREEWFALKLNADGTVSTGEITVRDELFLYPNPVKDMLHIGYPQGNTPIAIELYDLQGRLVQTQTQSLESLRLEGLAAGQYLMRVTLKDGKVFTDKVVKN